MIQTFGAYKFMFNRLKQPLTITKHSQNGYDDAGYPIKTSQESLQVNEPIVNSQNPNMTFPSMDGGQYSTDTLYWISRHGDFTKEDQVKSEDGEYKVTGRAKVLPKLFFYTIKRIDD
ncbi:hypothetical protein [Apilactobacillus apinorum]|uniref:hypothetical protein n=1 Tax=Apilactobacillus apinorum TaxID=1218495 RepID=UPI0006B5C051|nr:hypothetical protein [Apilactobacillus apinorum]KOY69004.1 hypothetical protein RZ74_08040 [Apilactobacillus apinorum]CAI2679534.1 Hypothetical protein AAPFHON13_08540 [Apilactobacillus apinorum]